MMFSPPASDSGYISKEGQIHMHSRDFDSFFSLDHSGNLASPTYDLSFLNSTSVVNMPRTTWDGPAGGSVGGSLDGSPEVEQAFTVHLTAGVTYSFAERPTATGGIEDPFLYLLNPSGGLITYDDDGGAGRSSLLSYTPTTTGDYTLLAGSWVNDFNGGGDVGNFNLFQWDSTQTDAGSTMATAVTISTGTTFGQAASGTDIDMYKIDLTHGQFYTFGYSGGYDGAGETGNIARIQLLDSAGNVVSSGLATESGMSFLAQNDGTYYVKVTPYTALGTHSGGYTLDVSAVDPASKDLLDAIRWKSANNIQTHDVDGVATATIYFGLAGENFGQLGDDGNPMVTLGWTQTQINSVLNALNTSYSPITGIHYVQTMDQDTATFRLATDHSTVYGAYFDPQDPAYGASQGVGVFNVDSGGFSHDESLQQGGFSYAVVLHEFGHAQGLAHPHDNGGGSDVLLGVTASQGSYGIYNLNQQVYTVMSYNYAWPLDPDGVQPFTLATIGRGWDGSLSALDIAALQERYGVHAFNTGNDVYTISDDQTHAFYQTIWDTGGTDTLAYAGTKNVQIDLTAATLDYSATGGGVLSFAHGIFGGYTIAHGVTIENATGGDGSDVIIGNSVANVLTGNGGDDTLMGRTGDDLIVAGAGNDKAYGGDGFDVIQLGAGNDTFFAELGTKSSSKVGQLSWDVITDFTTGSDKIDLSELHHAFAFHGTSANKAAGDLTFKVYDSVNGAEKALGIDIDGHNGASGISGPVTVVFANLDGGTPDVGIVLLNHSGVGASDFIFG
jgi:hypothetical protein